MTKYGVKYNGDIWQINLSLKKATWYWYCKKEIYIYIINLYNVIMLYLHA